METTAYQPLVLVETSELPREEWLAYRRRGIGGSDAAAVLGISPFMTGRDLYYDKLGISAAADDENWVAPCPMSFFTLCLPWGVWCSR